MRVTSKFRQDSWWHRFELPTWAVVATIYGGFVALTWHYRDLPWGLVAVLGALLVAWQGSLQHEAVHGHPTRFEWLNALIAGLPLNIWLPYKIYRSWHRAHHRAQILTCPRDDPESFYLTPASWSRAGPARRAILTLHNSLAGRLLLGPPLLIGSFLIAEGRYLIGGDRRHLGAWLTQVLGIAVLVFWLSVCGLPIWFYLLAIVWPAVSMTLLRSYHEHRPSRRPEERTATVLAAPPLALLYLNNNLHAAHHARPDLAWYDLPRFHREALREKGYIVPGYGWLFRCFLFRPKDIPVHPH